MHNHDLKRIYITLCVENLKDLYTKLSGKSPKSFWLSFFREAEGRRLLSYGRLLARFTVQRWAKFD